ncbi:MAG: 5'-nucleotidase C-terminal domain-containing protein [Tissierellia bacterium]|nr:5'-nucleotidase C-terminal domain-containing protein [Tissierellia bacterium]
MNRHRKPVALLLLALLMILPGAVFAEEETPDVNPETKTITILHTNDVHGRAVENEKDAIIGFAKLKGYADTMDNEIILDAGDILHGTTFATISRGESMVKVMNAVGYVAMTPGNHDFNYGYERLLELNEMADFDILGGNLITNSGKRDLPMNKIVEVNGVKVGIFGITTEETKTKSSPLNTQNVTFLDEVEVAKENVAALKADGAEVIVGLVHLGLDESSKVKSSDIAAAVEGIDVLVDGHSHSVLPNGQKVGGTLIVSTGNHFQNLGKVDIQVEDGKVLTATATLLDYESFKNITPDATVEGVVAAVEEANKPYLEKVVGVTAVELDGVRENVRTGETNLGNLVTDAMLKVAAADIAITNGGGIRDSIDVGDITMNEVLTSFPFTNYPVALEVTGQDILDALEYGVDQAPEVVGKFPHVAGATFQYDEKQEAGNRVFNVKIGGEDLDLKKTYTLVTNDFMSIGGDGYEMFKGKTKLAEYPLMSEVLAQYIEEKSPIAPEVEGRITKGEKPVDPVTPEEPEEPQEEVKFDDISGHWAEEEIKKAVANKLFKGMSETEFGPQLPITRAMLVTTLGRLEAVTEEAKEVPFADVEAGSWYAQGVAWAYENKIVNGYEDGSFKPNQEITREEMAAMLGRYLVYKQWPVTLQAQADFADQDEIADWASEYLEALRNTGVLNGRENNKFEPKANATRAELAKVMNRLFDLKVANENEEVPQEEKPEEKPEEQTEEKPAA